MRHNENHLAPDGLGAKPVPRNAFLKGSLQVLGSERNAYDREKQYANQRQEAHIMRYALPEP
jgi:hypothetical protein